MTRAATLAAKGEDVGRTESIRWHKMIIAAAALVLVASSLFLPLWRSTLAAPQYPGGLELIAFGNRVEGDLAEIDSLNHYIGMRPFRLEDFPEIALWPLGVGVAAAAVLIGVFLRRRVVGRLARWYLWFFPVSVLAVIQFRLYQFGHDLDPGAAFRMDGFTPWVIGPTKVWNFTAWSRPGAGIFMLLLAAAIASFGPRVLHGPPARKGWGKVPAGRKGREVGGNRSFQDQRRMAAVLVVAVGLLVGGFAAPAYADHEHDDHSGHDQHGPAGPSTVTFGETGPFPDGIPPRPPTTSLIDLEAMIAATPDGGTLHLPAAAYRGGVSIDRPMTIEGHGWPLLVGDRSGTVLTITAPGVVVRGIQVTGSGAGPSGQPAGIRITGDGVALEKVVVDDSYIGVAVDGANRVRIIDSLIAGRATSAVGDDSHAAGADHDHHQVGGRGDGISLWNVNGAVIRGSLVTGARDAIYISFGEGILIDTNHLTNSRYGVHTMYGSELVLIENIVDRNLSGLVLMYGFSVDVLRNHLDANRSPSTGFGVLVKDVIDVEIVQNIVTGNRVGVHLDGPAGGSEPIRATANTVANNDFGVIIFPSAQAVMMANSFVDNRVQVGREGRTAVDNVLWNDRGWGNFWSNYQGYDNGIGKGTAPHVEGSATHRILSRAPLLTAIASTPAMRLVQVMEERWLESRPMAVDEIPLIHPVSPALPASTGEPLPGMAMGLIGVAMVAIAAGALATTSRRGVRYG